MEEKHEQHWNDFFHIIILSKIVILMLANIKENIKENKDLIYGAEEFDNFELYLEWKIPPGGNSGIFYHIKEGYETISEISPEYQIIDDENYIQYDDITEYNLSLGYTENPNELKPLQQTAADYAMHAADTMHKILYPTGKWNSSKIDYTTEKAEHWRSSEPKWLAALSPLKICGISLFIFLSNSLNTIQTSYENRSLTLLAL